eukprot:7067768-Prymnesium_polylepis.2
MQGSLSISVPAANTLADASISASGSAAFCLLGSLSFSGSLSSTAASCACHHRFEPRRRISLSK